MTNIGGLDISCYIPTPTVSGVIKGIPLNVDSADILHNVTNILDCKARKIQDISIVSVQRLTLKNGELSKAVRINFQAFDLPARITLNKIDFIIELYQTILET